MSFVVMKFGGTSVANIERIRNVARHVKRESRRRQQGGGRRLGHGRDHQPAGDLGAGGLGAARCARVRRGGRHRRAGHRRAARHRAAVAGRPGPLVAGLADPDRHRQRARRGAHPRHSRRQDPRPPRPGRGGRDRRLPGHRAGAQPHLHPGPGRLGHQRGGHRRGGEGRPVRHLHRRRRRLHHRPAHRPQGAPAAEGLLRGDAGDGLAGLEGAADALGRAGHGTQDAPPRAVELRRPGGVAARPGRQLGRGRHHHLRRG